jgi:hypothetical protein
MFEELMEIAPGLAVLACPVSGKEIVSHRASPMLRSAPLKWRFDRRSANKALDMIHKLDL